MSEKNISADNQPIDALSTEKAPEIELDKEQEYFEFQQALKEINAEMAKENDEESEFAEPADYELSDIGKKSEEQPQAGNQSEQKGGQSSPLSTLSKEAAEEQAQLKLTKALNSICYDLALPHLTAEALKSRVKDAIAYPFNGYTMFLSKIKYFKKEIKSGLSICAVIGWQSGESTLKSKCGEITAAKKLKATQVAVYLPLSLVYEGNAKAVAKEVATYKKYAGKLGLKVVVNAAKLEPQQIVAVAESVVTGGADVLVLADFASVNQVYAVRCAKICAHKCKLELEAEVLTAEQLKALYDLGAERFTVKSAPALAETLKRTGV